MVTFVTNVGKFAQMSIPMSSQLALFGKLFFTARPQTLLFSLLVDYPHASVLHDKAEVLDASFHVFLDAPCLCTACHSPDADRNTALFHPGLDGYWCV